MPRIDNWMDAVFWALFAGVALFILGTFLKILWDSFHIFSEPRMPRRGHARSAMGGLGGDTSSSDYSISSAMSERPSDLGSGTSVEIADAGDSGSDSGGDSGGGDFSGGGGDYGGGGSGGSWS